MAPGPELIERCALRWWMLLKARTVSVLLRMAPAPVNEERFRADVRLLMTYELVFSVRVINGTVAMVRQAVMPLEAVFINK